MTTQTQTTTKQVTLSVEMRAKPGKEVALKQTLLSLVGPTLKEEGCINYILHEDPQDPANFLFYENWTSAEALEAHKATPHISAFFNIVGDLVVAQPQLRVWKLI
jgi:quinol monooxygenase YgiN